MIVGYSHSEFADDGLSFKSSAFAAIGMNDANDNKCVRLSDLKVTGYMDTMGGCWNGVYITVLKKNGANKTIDIGGGDTMEVTYFWNEEEGSMEAGWYDGNLTPMKDDASPLGNADEITFDLGEGIVVTSEVNTIIRGV